MSHFGHYERVALGWLSSSRRWRGLVVAAAFLLSACDDECAHSSCLPYGTYVDLNPELDTASAQFCLDDDCQTILAGEGGEPDQATNGFQSNVWDDGRTLQLSITVYDSAGNVVGSIAEERTMDSDGCACGVFFYEWRDNELRRLN